MDCFLQIVIWQRSIRQWKSLLIWL